MQNFPDTWVICYHGTLYCYLLIGSEKAMLIDTAYGDGDLRAFVETITDKPVMVCNTHGHFDHTGGNALWEEAWMSEAASKDAKNAFGEEMTRRFQAMPHPDYKINILHDGDVIDLAAGRSASLRSAATTPEALPISMTSAAVSIRVTSWSRDRCCFCGRT